VVVSRRRAAAAAAVVASLVLNQSASCDRNNVVSKCSEIANPIRGRHVQKYPVESDLRETDIPAASAALAFPQSWPLQDPSGDDMLPKIWL